MLRLLIVGIPQPSHVGRHFLNAATSLGWEVTLMDVHAAFASPVWLRRVCWHLLGHRPPLLAKFSQELVTRCRQLKPDLVLVTGIAPVNEVAMRQLRNLGIPVVNFLTDDPWNPQHRASWFMRTLPHFQHVFTPRHANEPDLIKHGASRVSYLPFAYAPEEHHPPADLTEEDRRRWGGLVAFIGGADADRVAMVRILVRAGVPVGLWGGYWREQPDLAAHAHGHADAETCRKIVAVAGANLCLVRRANRDGHSMRSYELAAIGGCLLVEATEDHRELFGADDSAALCFESDQDLVRQARHLLSLHADERLHLAEQARRRVLGAANTYSDRLKSIHQIASATS